MRSLLVCYQVRKTAEDLHRSGYRVYTKTYLIRKRPDAEYACGKEKEKGNPPTRPRHKVRIWVKYPRMGVGRYRKGEKVGLTYTHLHTRISFITSPSHERLTTISLNYVAPPFLAALNTKTLSKSPHCRILVVKNYFVLSSLLG